MGFIEWPQVSTPGLEGQKDVQREAAASRQDPWSVSKAAAQVVLPRGKGHRSDPSRRKA